VQEAFQGYSGVRRGGQEEEDDDDDEEDDDEGEEEAEEEEAWVAPSPAVNPTHPAPLPLGESTKPRRSVQHVLPLPRERESLEVNPNALCIATVHELVIITIYGHMCYN